MEGHALQALQLVDLRGQIRRHGARHRVDHLAQPARHLHLGVVRLRQVHRHDLLALAGQHLRDQPAREDQAVDRVLDQLRLVAQQPLCVQGELRARQIAVAGAVRRLRQRVLHAGAQAVFAVQPDAQRRGDLVRRLEADALDVLHQPVGVLADDLLHVLAVLLEDLHREVGRHAVALQEDHRLALLRLLGVALHDHLCALGADARHVHQLFRLGIQHIQRLLAEGLDQQLGRRRANAADHAAAQVLFDARERRRLLDLAAADLDLPAVNRVLRPFAGDFQLFARRDGRHDAHGGHARFAGLDDQHRIAVVVIPENGLVRKGLDLLHPGTSSSSIAGYVRAAALKPA